MIRALIIDDEPLARDELSELLKQHQDVELIGQANNAIEGMGLINKLSPELVFLDIQMPKISGIEMLGMLDPDNMPKIVFVTAFDEHAITAFENNAFDYLLKPVAAERLCKTLKRVRDGRPQPSMAPLITERLEHLPCSTQNTLKVVRLQDVEYVYSDLTGVHAVTQNCTHHTHMTLKLLEERSGLLRCHRQYLVNPEVIAEINVQDGGFGEIQTQSGKQIPVSRRYLKSIKQVFGFQ